MLSLRVTLCGDGSSDRVLIEPVRWLIDEIAGDRSLSFEVVFADVRSSPLTTRVAETVRLYPCDVLVVHRDAEIAPVDRRIAEIEEACSTVRIAEAIVPVVPVRMTEAWLLFDERAIRLAADNPNGTVELALPRLARLESLPDPKSVLRESLARASEKRARRMKVFRAEMSARVHRVAQRIETYAPLRALPSFARFERDLRSAVEPLLQAAGG